MDTPLVDAVRFRDKRTFVFLGALARPTDRLDGGNRRSRRRRRGTRGYRFAQQRLGIFEAL